MGLVGYSLGSPLFACERWPQQLSGCICLMTIGWGSRSQSSPVVEAFEMRDKLGGVALFIIEFYGLGWRRERLKVNCFEIIIW